ncbi:MAG: hypothetical protein K6E34_03445 [Lachnospiraceae bacterium]|nr:hypothetical protein [Lachnospiraceae bacterium]
MIIKELTVDKWIDHLKKHPVPELMDEECAAALENVRAEYGSTISHGAGLEVRLTEEARYVDYIMSIDTEEIPHVDSLWYELDYDAFREEKKEIIPCLFANVSPDEDGGYTKIRDEMFPAMMGVRRTELLKKAFDDVVSRLPKGATIKQVGSMSSRGELDIMRLVISFPSWEKIPEGLSRIGWTGDVKALQEALAPWKETGMTAVNIDLGENGVLSKIGMETSSRWRQPILVDKFIDRLEAAGLCIPSKGKALRRWIRQRPQGDPFIQTLISYFKLAYRDGRITEAKAYLEQSPYIHHHYFEAYESPVRLDLQLHDGTSEMPYEKAASLICEAAESGITAIHLYGMHNKKVLQKVIHLCEDNKISAKIVISDPEDADPLFIDNTLLRWTLKNGNAGGLPDSAKKAEELGIKEFTVCSDEPCSREELERAAGFVEKWQRDETHGMSVAADSCFSQLKAFMGGEDPRRNPNRGIESGCMAGRAFFAVSSDGSFTPCLKAEKKGVKNEAIKDYWEKLTTDLPDGHTDSCEGCHYKRRCRPCIEKKDFTKSCPLRIKY